jgi:fatty-acyl-CoA synthase
MKIGGGKNIYPSEIEELLLADPKVDDDAVCGLSDDKWGEKVGAFIRAAKPADQQPTPSSTPIGASTAPRTRQPARGVGLMNSP